MTTYTLIINTFNNCQYGHLISMLLSQREVFTTEDVNYNVDINIRRNDATNIYVFISDIEESGQLVTVCNKTTGINQTMPMQECFDRIPELFT
jgi:hypothetical protein